jgi:hypothetical protein
VTAGDLVIFLADPLMFSGELLVLEVTDDNKLLCEQVNYEPVCDEPPPRGVFDPHDLELADVWAKAA